MRLNAREPESQVSMAWPRVVMLCSRHLDLMVEFSLLPNTSELVHPSVCFLDECLKNPLSFSIQNLFAITRFRNIEILFHIFYCYWGKENRSLHHGLRYIVIEVRYIEVPLYVRIQATG